MSCIIFYLFFLDPGRHVVLDLHLGKFIQIGTHTLDFFDVSFVKVMADMSEEFLFQ